MRTRTVLVVLCGALVVTAPAGAEHRIGHRKPAAPAARHLPADFPVRADAEWAPWPVGGFGGGARSARLPIVFVHGNVVDAASWYPVADRLVAAHGYLAGDLWAVSFNGVGCQGDGALYTANPRAAQDRAASDGCAVTDNQGNVADVAAFIEDVMAYTGSARIHVVAHSLGVTIARRALYEDASLAASTAGFVAIAGANHGSSLCWPGSETLVQSCDEIAAGTPWLQEMNAAGEAPPPARWMTVYDGTGLADPAFLGPYAQSPRLEGAANCEYPGFYHNDLRVDPRIVDHYAGFLAAAEAGSPFACPEAPPPIPS